MELRHLRYFIAVAEELNFTRAAEKLMIAQPPLSRQIRDLETELEAELFIRTSHGLHLTPEGHSFLQYARQIIRLSDRSKEEIQEMARGVRGTIDIASVEGNAPSLMAGWIASFKEIYPEVQYSLWDGNTDEVIYRVSSGLSEIGMITEPYNAESLYALPVYREPWAALIPASDPLAGEPGDTIPVSALTDRDLIIPSRASRLSEIRTWFPGDARNLRIRCRLAHLLNALELTRRGVGISIYPISDQYLSPDPRIVVKRLVEPEVFAAYLVVWQKEAPLSHAADLFLHLVCEKTGTVFPGRSADRPGKNLK